MNDYCPDEPFRGSFLELFISIPTFIIFQLILLIHTFYYIYKEKQKTINSKCVRMLFILLQICGLYWTCIDLFRFIIDSNTFILRSNIGCKVVAYSPKIAPIMYYFIYLHIIFLRLKLSFKDTFVAIHKCTHIILSSIINIPAISFFILLYFLSQPYCVYEWEPIDLDMTLTFCDVYTTNNLGLLAASAVIWVVLTNIILSFMLCLKLKTFLKRMDSESSFKLKSLKIRNCILPLIASSSTLFTWFCWLTLGNILSFSITFVLYFDIWFNCVVLSLMFKYNDYYYKKLCKYCIIGCFGICDRKYKNNKKLKEYLNEANIFASNTKSSVTNTEHNTTTSATSTGSSTPTTTSTTTTTTAIPSIQITSVEIIYEESTKDNSNNVDPTPSSKSIANNKQLEEIDL